ncbi:hypothetical protein CYMTET_6521 [Cymbomonas tetramitiformis]|uniref:Uncharacterized protein n=1 Tax=Cymbomonas tetramitiformis TaxID=36881 RepID=A0AAE0LID8_9CHLO|nr:hypothetical protein CYMTET_6521 [Cymbomonas tetramitiformis]
MNRHFQGKDHAATSSFINGANLAPLPDSHAHDLQQFIKQYFEKHATITTLEARGEFYRHNYPDVRPEHTQCSQGYPLETPYGTRNEKNETVYTLLRNCTVVGPKDVDENDIPTGKYGQVMVASLRSYGPLVVEYLSHMTATVRHFHGLGEGTMVVSQEFRPRIRWVGDKVAALCLTFVKPEYAATVMSTTLAHLLLRCGKLGTDVIPDRERAVPRVRIANQGGDSGGAEERQLCITSSAELKGRHLQSLEQELLDMSEYYKYKHWVLHYHISPYSKQDGLN